MIVDMHSHFVPQALLDDLAKQSAFPSVKTTMEKGGVEKMMTGSDFPFSVGDPERVIEASGFSDKERGAIVGGTAAKLFHIETSVEAR